MFPERFFAPRYFSPLFSQAGPAPIPLSARIVVDGVDRTGYLDYTEQFNVSLTRGQIGTANLTFEIPPGDPFSPPCGAVVFLYEIYQAISIKKCIFAGTVATVEIGFVDDTGHHRISVTLQSLEQSFDGVQTPTVEYTNVTTGSIFTDLFSQSFGQLPVGLTLGTVGAGVLVDSRKYDDKTSVKSAFDQLATDTPGYIWSIDPDTLTVNFHAFDMIPAPWPLVDGMIRRNENGSSTGKWKQDRQNFRNKQVIQQLTATATPPETASFPGPGTAFATPKIISKILSAVITFSTTASAAGAFSSQPSVGDTVTVGVTVYTFVAVLDNTVAFQVLIGGSTDETCQNLVNAINASGSGFSSPTYNNPYISASAPSGTTFQITSKQFGRGGNTVTLSATGAAFTWDNSALSGGTTSSTKQLSTGTAGSGVYDLIYTPGSTQVVLSQSVATGATLVITYVSTSGGMLSASSGVSPYGNAYQIMTARGANTVAAQLQQASAALSAYATLPAEFSFMVDWPGLNPGQYLTVAITKPLESGSLLNGNWIVQTVNAVMEPGMLKLRDDFDPSLVGIIPLSYPGGHLRYQIDCINTTDVQPWQDIVNRLADTGPNATNPDAATTPAGPKYGILHHRTLVITDTTVGEDIAPHLGIAMPHDLTTSPVSIAVGKGLWIVGVLRIPILTNLTVEIFKRDLFVSPFGATSWTITIPGPGVTDTLVIVDIDGEFNHLDILGANIIDSDGTTDVDGVAAFTIYWEIPNGEQ